MCKIKLLAKSSQIFAIILSIQFSFLLKKNKQKKKITFYTKKLQFFRQLLRTIRKTDFVACIGIGTYKSFVETSKNLHKYPTYI